MHLCIIISILLYLIHFLSLHKSLVYPPSVYILYEEFSEDVTGEYSSVKYQWCDIVCDCVTLSDIVCDCTALKKNVALFKGIQK